MASRLHSLIQEVHPQQSLTWRMKAFPSLSFLIRFPGQASIHLPHPAHLHFLNPNAHLSPAPFSAVFKPVFSFVIRSRYKILISPLFHTGVYIFHPLFALLRVVCILSETMPSGFLSGCQMCDHCLAHDQSFAKFINLHQFISICCCQSVNYWQQCCNLFICLCKTHPAVSVVCTDSSCVLIHESSAWLPQAALHSSKNGKHSNVIRILPS